MSIKRIFWDIETGPAPAAELDKLCPEMEAPKNYTDPAKIKAAIAEKRKAWMEECALRATTGRILAVTVAVGDSEALFFMGEERRLVTETLKLFNEYLSGAHAWKAYGFNCHGFDLPFLSQRAAALDTAKDGFPAFGLLSTYRGRWSWDDHFIDVLQVWCGGRLDSESRKGNGLDAVAKALGVGEKNGHGADFAALLASDPAKARDYAVNDVKLLRGIVRRMGI